MNIIHHIQKELATSQLDYLGNQFELLCQNSAIDKKHVSPLFKELLQAYQHGLDYHNLSHIFSFLQLTDGFQSKIKQPTAFYWAIWFHDAIYNPKKKDNEQKSAVLAIEKLQAFLSKKDLKQIESLILSTASHEPLKPKDSDHLLFLDMDLSILAAPNDTYKKYAQAIAQEYGHVPRFLYRFGRKRVMKNFLKRKHIFYSSFFREWGELKARENIQQEIRGNYN